MKHLGDITKINGAEIPPVDVICGGSPCQDLSIAGYREGLSGERSSLFLEQLRIIKEMRNADRKRGGTGVDVRPRYMVWENVPGAFSSNNGEDFRTVLEETARVADENAVIPGLEKNQKWTPSGVILADGFSIAWRVHDGQFWGRTIISDTGEIIKRGTPQRRRRISLVADFGGQTAPEILFERKSVSWDTAESEETWERPSAGTGESTGGSITFQERAGKPGGGKGILIQEEKTCSIRTQNNQCVFRKTGHPRNAEEPQGWEEAKRSDTLNVFDNTEARTPTLIVQEEPKVYENHSQDTRFKELDGVSTSVTAQFGTGGNNTPLVVSDKE